MNRAVVIGVLAGVGVAAAVAVSRKARSGPPQQLWDRMQHHMASLPENAPPRMMFDNIAATRANTEEILKLLRNGSSQIEGSNDDGSVDAPVADDPA